MTKIVRRWPSLLLVLGWLAAAGPARAHQGPPFPILMDVPAGPYVASVWTDPDVGTGLFLWSTASSVALSVGAGAAVSLLQNWLIARGVRSAA